MDKIDACVICGEPASAGESFCEMCVETLNPDHLRGEGELLKAA